MALNKADEIKARLARYNQKISHVKWTIFATSEAVAEYLELLPNELNAMLSLAAKYELSENFLTACATADATSNPEAIFTCREELIRAFGIWWKTENKASYKASLDTLGYKTALLDPSVENLTIILSTANKPIFRAYWDTINTLMDHALNDTQITALVEKFSEKGKIAIREKVTEILESMLHKSRGHSMC